MFKPCKCIDDALFAQYLIFRTLESILLLWDDACDQCIKQGIKFKKIYNENGLFVGAFAHDSVQVLFPQIIGCSLYVLMDTFDVIDETNWTHGLRCKFECPLCTLSNEPPPTSFIIHGSIQYLQSMSTLDNRRPFFEKSSKKWILYRNKLCVSAFLPEQTNSSLSEKGSLICQHILPVSAVMAKQLVECSSWMIGKTLNEKNANQISNRLRTGHIDNIINRRKVFMKDDENEDFCFKSTSQRYHMIEHNGAFRYQQVLTCYKMTPINYHLSNNRYGYATENGLASIGFITETKLIGTQLGLVIGTEFVRFELSHQEMKLRLLLFDDLNVKQINVIWGDTLEIEQIFIPANETILYETLKYCQFDFCKWNDEYFYLASLIDTPLIRPLNEDVLITPFTLDFIRKNFSFNNLLLNPFSIGELTIPFFGNSHAPKTMQAVGQLRQCVSHDVNLNFENLNILMTMKSESIIGSPVKTVPVIYANAILQPKIGNDEDGLVVNTLFAKKATTKRIYKYVIPCKTFYNYKIFNKHKSVTNHQNVNEIFLIVFGNIHIERLHFDLIDIVEIRPNAFKISFKQNNLSVVKIQKQTDSIKLFIQKVNYCTLGDKFTTPHGQKCTITSIIKDEFNYPVVYFTPSCLKRMPVGDLLYGMLLESKLDPSISFAFSWYRLDLELKKNLVNFLVENFSSNKTFKIPLLRINKNAIDFLSYSNSSTVIRDQYCGQNIKGKAFSGSTSYTLNTILSLAHQGAIDLDYFIRKTLESENRERINFSDNCLELSNSSLLCNRILAAFKCFNIDLNKI